MPLPLPAHPHKLPFSHWLHRHHLIPHLRRMRQVSSASLTCALPQARSAAAHPVSPPPALPEGLHPIGCPDQIRPNIKAKSAFLISSDHMSLLAGSMRCDQKRPHQNAEAVRLGAGHHSGHLPSQNFAHPFHSPATLRREQRGQLHSRHDPQLLSRTVRPHQKLRVPASLHKHPHGRAPHRQREDHSSFLLPAPVLLALRLQPPGGALKGVALRPVRHRRRVPRQPRSVLGDEGAGSNHGHLSFRREGGRGFLLSFLVLLRLCLPCPLCCLVDRRAVAGPGGAVEGVKG